MLDELSLRPAVIDVGLDYNVGTAGSRLSLAQRQRAAIARAVLKRPDLLILNEATSALDGQAQAKVTQGLREEFAGRGLIWVLHRAEPGAQFRPGAGDERRQTAGAGPLRRARPQGFADHHADGGGMSRMREQRNKER